MSSYKSVACNKIGYGDSIAFAYGKDLVSAVSHAVHYYFFAFLRRKVIPKVAMLV